MGKKQNVAQKYLTQKSGFLLDAVFGVLLGGGAILFLLGWLYYGIVSIVIGAVGLVCTKSVKIKDEEYEEALAIIIRDSGIDPVGDETIALYDLGRGTVVFAKDKKPKSGFWVISDLKFKNGVCEVTKYDIDVVQSRVETETKSFVLPCPHTVEEHEISTPMGRKKIAYLYLGNKDIKLPVDVSSVDTDRIIKRLSE